MSTKPVMGVICFWLCCTLLPTTAFAADCDPWVARLVSREGTVDVKRFRGQDWLPADTGVSLCLGDQVRVGADARASVELDNDTVLRLDARSTLVLPEPSHSGFSFVELLEGALHLISRVKGKLEVRTPFVNAGLEGTEFVVRIRDDETIVSVIEGKVAVFNGFGALSLNGGQTASARAGSAPVLRLDLKPDDAVHWALFYPLTRDPRTTADAPLANAHNQLRVGRVDAAQQAIDELLASHPGDSEALALGSVIALAQNRKEAALQLARAAVESQPGAQALLALSYAQQAQFDLSGATETMLQATANHPEQALLWSRLAELQASLGRRKAAMTAAQRAVELDPELSRTQTVLGFAHLSDGDTVAARTAFDRAVSLDSADPLARLGSGLTQIRDGDLADGRREMEIAVSLDPGNSLVRSYLGKAYAAEGRQTEAEAEFALAKQLDPLDPTPWLYHALTKQADSRRIEAVSDFQQSAARNGNRAVFRSRLLLDDDLAVRNAVVGATFASIGLRDMALRHAHRALAANPANASAHALLADLYREQPRLGITRISERLQAQLLQPIAMRPVAPSELIRELDPAGGGGHFGIGSGEYGAFYTERDPYFALGGYVGGNDSQGIEAVHAGQLQDVSYSLGYFNYATDGFRDDADEDHKSANALVQWRVSDRLKLQLGARHQEKDQGDLRLGLDPRVAPDTEERALDLDVLHIGARAQLSDDTVLLALLADADRNEERFQEVQGGFIDSRDSSDDREGLQFEIQAIKNLDELQLVAGASVRRTDFDVLTLTTFAGFPPFIPPLTVPDTDEGRIRSKALYAYANWAPNDDVIATLGLSREGHDDPTKSDPVDYWRWNPKLGIQWQLVPSAQLRAAYFETTKHQLVTDATLEPTAVAGFAQFFDDFNRTWARSRAVALDLSLTDRISATAEHVYRKVNRVESPSYLIEKAAEFGISAIINDFWTATAGFRHQTDEVVQTFGFDLETDTFPVAIHYEDPRGFFGSARWTHFDQEWKPTGVAPIDTRFDSVDVAAGYRWNRGRYRVSVGIDDLLDDVEEYRDDRHKVNDTLNVYRPFVPGRTIWGTIQLAWD